MGKGHRWWLEAALGEREQSGNTLKILMVRCFTSFPSWVSWLTLECVKFYLSVNVGVTTPYTAKAARAFLLSVRMFGGVWNLAKSGPNLQLTVMWRGLGLPYPLDKDFGTYDQNCNLDHHNPDQADDVYAYWLVIIISHWVILTIFPRTNLVCSSEIHNYDMACFFFQISIWSHSACSVGKPLNCLVKPIPTNRMPSVLLMRVTFSINDPELRPSCAEVAFPFLWVHRLLLDRYGTWRGREFNKFGDINLCVDFIIPLLADIPERANGTQCCEFDVDLSQACESTSNYNYNIWVAIRFRCTLSLQHYLCSSRSNWVETDVISTCNTFRSCVSKQNHRRVFLGVVKRPIL